MVVIINFVSFSEWINGKFIEWRGDRVGKAASVAEFARQFGAPQQLVSSWMTPVERGGKIPRSSKYINALVAVYGNEVYDVLGLPVPEYEEIPADQLPPELRESLDDALRDVAALLEAGVSAETDEGLRRLITTLEERGFTIRSIK